MLPGFRFLFAATFLTMSILVFGLGAASLLRAAHEQFATNPSWHAAPEATFAQQVETARPLLAMLKVGTPAPEQEAAADTPAADIPAIPTPAEQSATAQPPAEATKLAALQPEPPTLSAAAKSDTPAPESPTPTIPPAAGDTPASGAPQLAETPASSDKVQVASTDQAAPAPPPPATQAAPAATGVDATEASPATSPVADTVATKIAALDSPSAVADAKPPAKVTAPSLTQARSRSSCGQGGRRIAAGWPHAPRGWRGWRRSCNNSRRPTRLVCDSRNRRRWRRSVAAEPPGLRVFKSQNRCPLLRNTRQSGRTGRDRRPVGQAPFGP